MWNITSNDVQQAKDQLQHRRAEIEQRYAEEKQALDAETAVIETLERAASAFALKRGREDAAAAVEPAETGPSTAEAGDPFEASDTPEDDAVAAAEPSAEPDPPAAGDVGNSLDILKPGSRWRLYRGNRPPEPEESSGNAFPTAG